MHRTLSASPLLHASRPRLNLLTTLLCAALLGGCGGGDGSGQTAAFTIDPGPAAAGGNGPTTPPPSPAAATWLPDAHPHQHVANFGSFPSAISLFDNTLFVTDADHIESAGIRIVPLDVAQGAPTASTRYLATTLRASALETSFGLAGDQSTPIGFGYFVGEVRVVSATLGFALVNAGGSDSMPTLSNLVVFNPTTGGLRQVVNLANAYGTMTTMLDSTGAPISAQTFVQSGAESVAYLQTSPTTGKLYVAMSNLVFGAPSNGSTKYPGTIQVYDVSPAAMQPVTPSLDPLAATFTIGTLGYNPVALSIVQTTAGTLKSRLLVTVAGTTGYDASFNLVPLTPSSVEIYDAVSGVYEGAFGMGLTGLAGIRPAIGVDAAGHHVGYFPSSTTGEVYLLRLDGLYDPVVDPDRLAVLRGPGAGIPVTAAASGGPGGNLTGIGLSPDGRTLVVAGFGDLFAFPTPIPGQLFLLALPDDVVATSSFGAAFTPGSSLFGTSPGRTMSELVLVPRFGAGPDVYVNVGGSLDPSTFVGTSPASVGTLETGGLIR